jgi:hypothetical protein
MTLKNELNENRNCHDWDCSIRNYERVPTKSDLLLASSVKRCTVPVVSYKWPRSLKEEQIYRVFKNVLRRILVLKEMKK